MSETNEYDVIFTALKHPVRRQILLLLEQKGEMPFTLIQKAVGIDDTGLMSYHLKELAPLVEQSAKGRYSLSEVGQVSIVLFRKVERERQKSSIVVRKELEKLIGEIVFLFFIVGVTLMAPLSVGMLLSVENVVYSNLSLEYMISMYAISLFGMVIGVVLFVFYDRHYFSKNIKTNATHSTIFALGISTLSTVSAYAVFQFEVSTSDVNGATLLFSILCSISILGITPLVVFGIGKLMQRNKN